MQNLTRPTNQISKHLKKRILIIVGRSNKSHKGIEAEMSITPTFKDF